MPVLISKAKYKAPLYLPGGHSQSIFPTFFRRMKAPAGCSELCIDTPDGDFIELDLYTNSHITNKKLLILSHGMEGNSRRKYILGMAKAFISDGWDVLAWNYRSCGSKVNLTARLYHCGDIADITTVINFALQRSYRQIVLGGFSMGGSVTLNYLGRLGSKVPTEVLGAITFSVPCDLSACSKRLDSGFNRIYTWNFLFSLRDKIRKKHQQMPGIYDIDRLDKINTLKEFDGRYTAPLHGFLSAEDYWDKSSCMHVLEDIKRPVLIVNAQNDPFLAGRCFPYHEAKTNNNIHLEVPSSGGHVGFTSAGEFYWSEQRALEFARNVFSFV